MPAVPVHPWTFYALLEWTNSNQGAITAIATALIAVMAVVTAWLTRTLARENRLLRKAGTEPEVVAYLLPDRRHREVLNLVLANIGQGPALAVTFRIEADEEDFRRHEVQLNNSEKRTALSILPQGERIPYLFGIGHRLFEEPRLKSFAISVEYRNLTGKRRSGRFPLDVSQFEGLITVGVPAEHEMAVALKAISEEIRRWRSHYGRIKVEVMTTEEQKRESDEIRELVKQHTHDKTP
jgi:hypothetical protein